MPLPLKNLFIVAPPWTSFHILMNTSSTVCVQVLVACTVPEIFVFTGVPRAERWRQID